MPVVCTLLKLRIAANSNVAWLVAYVAINPVLYRETEKVKCHDTTYNTEDFIHQEEELVVVRASSSGAVFFYFRRKKQLQRVSIVVSYSGK